MTARTRRARILCVDDDRLVRETLTVLVEELGLQVQCVSSGRECIDRVERQPEAYDLVLVNYEMPEMGGGEVVRRLLESVEKTHVALTSAYPETKVFHDVPRERVAGFIPKPYTLPGLRRFLRDRLPGADARVILAASEPLSRKLYRAMLEEEFDIRCYGTPREALGEARRTLRPVVVLDLPEGVLPKEASALRREEVPLVLLSGDQIPEPEMTRHGDVVPYPVQRDQLVRCVRRAAMPEPTEKV